MLNMKQLDGVGLPRAYQIFGDGKIDLVIELGLGAVAGEWLHLAEMLADGHTVLLYERQRKTKSLRTPQNIATELYELLRQLGHAEKITLLAHSQGGLYAQRFARQYPELTQGLVLLDPLSASDNLYKTALTPDEQKKSGFDKTANLAIMGKLARLHLGALIKATMKKAPPFYYYADFTPEASAYILQAITDPQLYTAALEEYRLAHDPTIVATLRSGIGFPDIPIALVTHSSEFMIREIMEFGKADRACAEKAEKLWQSLMGEYLGFSSKTVRLSAQNSGHSLHLTEPELLRQGLDWVTDHNSQLQQQG